MGSLTKSSGIIFTLLAYIALATAQYVCDPALCTGPNCHCASTAPPLPLDQMPQFVLFSHDDITGPVSVGLMTNATNGLTNPNGCPIPFTFFTMQPFTECPVVQEAWKAGHEIATHTWSHLPMPVGFKGGLGSVEAEIVSARDWLVSNCSIPAADVVGFRSPLLVNNPPYRKALAKNGFLYDSTINEHWPMPTSPSGSERVWPYTMDAGIPQDCGWVGNLCTPNETYAGLWEVPVWVLQTDTYPDPAYAMDPCTGESGKCDAVEMLKYTFNLAYNGNKAPVPMNTHSPYLTNYAPAMAKFVEWALQNNTDVYFVTYHQLIQWIQNPVPKDQMNDWLGCVPGGSAAGAGKAGVVADIPAAAPVPAPEVVAAAPVPELPVAPAPAVGPVLPAVDPVVALSPALEALPPVPAAVAAASSALRRAAPMASALFGGVLAMMVAL